MSLPIEIVLLLRDYSENSTDFKNFSSAFGIKVTRDDIYGKYWREFPVPYPVWGGIEWKLNEEKHYTDAPAVSLVSGYQAWYQHGLRHNDNGPAIIASH